MGDCSQNNYSLASLKSNDKVSSVAGCGDCLFRSSLVIAVSEHSSKMDIFGQEENLRLSKENWTNAVMGLPNMHSVTEVVDCERRKMGEKLKETKEEASVLGHFEVYLEGTRSHFTLHFALHFALHFLPTSREYSAKNDQEDEVTRYKKISMECSEAVNVVMDAKKKEEWVLEANAIHFIGASGNGKEMYAQLQYVLSKTNLPVDRDAARKLFNERVDLRSKTRGLKMPGDHFGTQNQASFILPLLRTCRFSINPPQTLVSIEEMDEDIYPLVQWFNDLDTAQRGGIYQKFIIQPWILENSATAVVGTLLLSFWADVQSVSDCYVMLYEHLAEKLGEDCIQGMARRIQIVADRMRLDSRSGGAKSDAGKRHGEWRPWGYKLLVEESEMQFSDISMIQEALANYPLAGGAVDVKGVRMLFIPANISIRPSHEATLADLDRVPCVLLNGTGASKLTYILNSLEAVGVNMGDIMSVSYTRGYGFKGVRMLPVDHNILIRFRSICAAVQLAQWWNGLYLASAITPLTKVTAIYLYDEVSLSEQDFEPQLYQRKMIMEYKEFMANIKKVPVSSPELLCPKRSYVEEQNRDTYADITRHAKRKADACLDGDDSSDGSTVNESCSSCDEVKILQNAIHAAFATKPKDVLFLLAGETQRMINAVLQYYGDNLAEAVRDADDLKQIASDHKCPKLRHLVNKAISSSLAARKQAGNVTNESVVNDDMEITVDNMPVGMIWSDSELEAEYYPNDCFVPDEYFPDCGTDDESDCMDCTGNDYDSDEDFITYDYKQFTTTLSNGACGYVSICAVLMHMTGDLTHIYPAIYINNMHLLGCHLWMIANSLEMEKLPQLRNKLKIATTVLESLRWREVLSDNQQMWLTVAETTLIMRAFNVPCRSWMWTADGYKCFNNGVRDCEKQCYNLMYHMGHFYVHRDRVAKEIPHSMLCVCPVPSWLKGGSIMSSLSNPPLLGEKFKFWTLLNDHNNQRSTKCCRIYPSMTTLSSSICYECKQEGLLLEKIDRGGADPMDVGLLHFYWENHGSNKWVAIERHLMYGMEFNCAVAKRSIPPGTVIAPVVGVLTPTVNSTSAVPCSHVYSEVAGMNYFLDPTPVGFDTGYYMFLTPDELLEKCRIPLNVARYAKVAWPSLGVIPNAMYYNDDGERTIWLVTIDYVPRGCEIWIKPPDQLRLNLNPLLVLCDPPRPSGTKAYSVPKQWGDQVVECILSTDSEEEISEEEHMVRYEFHFSFSEVALDAKILNQAGLFRMLLIVYKEDRFVLVIRDICDYFPIKMSAVLADSSNKLREYFGNSFSFGIIGIKIKTRSNTSNMFTDVTINQNMFELVYFEGRVMVWNDDKSVVINLFGPAFSSDNAGDGPEEDELELKQIEEGLEITEWSAEDDLLLRVGGWNSNGHLVANDTEIVVKLVRSLKLDVLMLSDTRLHKRAADWKIKEIKRTLKGYTVVSFNTTRSSYTRGGGARMNTMGGTMFIISPRCAAKVVDTGDDGSGLGIAGYVKVIANDLKLCFISMYQPIGGDNAGESTVLARLQSHLHRKRIDDSPKMFIMNTVSKWINKSRNKGFVSVIAGDFNADPLLAGGSKLKIWAQENEVVNILQETIKLRYYTHMRKGCPITCIDHFYADQMLLGDVVEGHIIRKPCLTALSDHCVICFAFKWPNGMVTTKDEFTEITGVKRIEIQHYDQNKLQEYQEGMEEWFANHEELKEISPADGLALLMEQSVNMVKELTDSQTVIKERIGFRSSVKNGYSPCFMALKSAYTLVLCYHQNILRATQQKRLWAVQHNCNVRFRRLSIEWQRQYPTSDFADDEFIARAHGKANDILMNLRLLSNITVEELYARSRELRNLMHGRLRAEYRKRMSERVAAMEELREQKRLGILFNMVNLKEKPQLDLSVLNINGVAITNPRDIHVHLTDHFASWYRTPDELHTIAQDFHNGNLWRQAVNGIDAGWEDDSNSGFLVRSFFDACRTKATDHQKFVMIENVCAPISLQEYQNEIQCIKYGKAPGPSGVTANMVKAWPESIHEQVLTWLNQIWTSKTVPAWWLKGHLKPIPKSGEMSLDNLRPLGLYEISRKILTAIIIKRILRTWENNDMLNANQHAFRHGLSTTHAIMRLVNVAEDAAEREVPLWQILWDFRRAFDSISFNFVRLALVRLAVPTEVMEFLLFLMENNEMTVASPYHMANMLINGPANCNDEFFHQERGTGQGDPPSPVIWIAIFDVLLEMLGSTENTASGFLAQGSACEVYTAHDTAFADDLATIAGSHAEQQLKANIVCTFCACTGMQISMAKIRAFAVNCTTSVPGIVLRNHHWEASIISPSTEKVAMKYLGFFSDHVGGDEHAFRITENYLQSASMMLIHCHAPKEVKLLIYRMQIVPKVLYVATKACWNLEQYRKLDKYAARILKHVGGQMMSSANAMMFFPKDMCGLGVHSISNLAQSQKWGEFVRVLDSNSEAAKAATGLLERALRQTVQQAPPTQNRTIIYQNLEFLKGYAGSLIEWGNEVGHSLHNSAKLEYTDSNKAILPYLYNERIDDDIIKQLQRKDITAQGELVCHMQNGSMCWGLDETTMLVRRRLADNMMAAPTDEGLVLNGGQMYAIEDVVYEVIGMITDKNLVACYEWRWLEQSANTIFRSSLYELAHVNVRMDVFETVGIKRVITIPSKRTRTQMESSFTRRVISIGDCAIPSRGIAREFQLPDCLKWFIAQVEDLQELNGCRYTVFTDGSSRAKNEIPLKQILLPDAVRRDSNDTSAAIIAIANSEQWREHECVVLQLMPSDYGSNGIQSFEAELIALVLAAHVQDKLGVLVHTDCKSAKETVERVCTRGSKRTKLGRIRTIISSLTELDSFPIIQWVASHPERRKDQEDWSFCDWGIYLADLAASGSLEKLTGILEIRSYSEDITSVATNMIMPGEWYWAIGLTGVPNYASEIRLHSYKGVEDYLRQRDIYRESRDEPARWTGSSLSMANKGWRKIMHGALGSNTILKNVLDKYWHGRNRAKGIIGAEKDELLACSLCGLPDSQEHIFLECNHKEMQQLRYEAQQHLVRTAENEMRLLSDYDTQQQRVIRYFMTRAYDEEYDFIRFWVGTWNYAMLRDALGIDSSTLIHTVPYVKYSTAMDIEKIITNLGHPLKSAVLKMMSLRHELERGVAESKKPEVPAEAVKRQRENTMMITITENLTQDESCQMRKKRKASKRASSKGSRKVTWKRRKKCKNKRKARKRTAARCSSSVTSFVDTGNTGIIDSVSHPRGETESCDYDKD